ncbi:MAG: TRAM domain-containing protein [Arcanobacterium sp.]|nr:TRAM domain-containing protein [Arcanobacterium sp.]
MASNRAEVAGAEATSADKGLWDSRSLGDSSLELDLTDIAHGGLCVGRAGDGRVVFARGGIPGERVRVQIMRAKKRFATAVVQQVLRAVPQRIAHPWPAGAAGATGAADFGHIDLDFQRELKGRVIRTQVERIGGAELAEQLADMELTARSIDPRGEAEAKHHGGTLGPGWHTRTRFDVVKLPTGVGMYREHSHELIPLDSMPLAVGELESLGVCGAAWDSVIAPSTRLHVVAPASGPNAIVILGEHERRGNGHRASGAPPIGAELRRIGDGVVILEESDGVLHERASDGRELYDYDLAPAGFWQIHHRAPSALLTRVMRGAQLAGGERVLELFAGAGLFSLPMARAIGAQGRLLTLEGSERAVANGVSNLSRYPWAQARQAWIDARTVRQALAEARPELVIADPPRAGLGIDCAREIAVDSAVQRVVLVSCDPAAMARDTGVFAHAGWRVRSCEVLDLFPHTHHIETVCLLTRKMENIY